MNHDGVSVIIPTYNRGYCLGEAIKSVLGQTYVDLELVICDDCSTDNTEEVVRQFNDNRIIYHKNSRNWGLPKNRNLGIELSHFRFLIFWEDDITFEPDGVQLLVETAKQLEQKGIKIGAVSPRVVEESKKGKLLSFETSVANNVRSKLNKPSYISKWTGLMFKNMVIESDNVLETELVNPWSLFNKDAIKEVGGYSPVFGRIVGYSHEETDLFVRLAKKGYGLYYQAHSVSYHKHTKFGGTRVNQVRYGWNYFSAHAVFLVKDYGWRSLYMMPLCGGYVGINMLKYLPLVLQND